MNYNRFLSGFGEKAKISFEKIIKPSAKIVKKESIAQKKKLNKNFKQANKIMNEQVNVILSKQVFAQKKTENQ